MRRRNKLPPPPPPTPEGMMWANWKTADGLVETRLVPTEDVHRACKDRMAEHDQRYRPARSRMDEIGLGLGRADD